MDVAALRRLWPLAAVAVLLTLTAVAAAHSSLPVRRIDATVTDGDAPAALPEYARDNLVPTVSPPSALAAAEPGGMPRWLLILAAGLCLAAVVVVLGLLLRTLIRDLLRRRIRAPATPSRPASAGSTAEVVAAVDAGLVDLADADAAPRHAVIACWVRLEQAAAAAGTPRQIADTPTDLVTRLLAGHAISAGVLSVFAGVYREARYATHVVDERMREQARSALSRLRGELTVSAEADRDE